MSPCDFASRNSCAHVFKPCSRNCRVFLKHFQVQVVEVALQFVCEQQTRCACTYHNDLECSLRLIDWIFGRASDRLPVAVLSGWGCHLSSIFLSYWFAISRRISPIRRPIPTYYETSIFEFISVGPFGFIDQISRVLLAKYRPCPYVRID